jgi:hypothetical protein
MHSFISFSSAAAASSSPSSPPSSCSSTGSSAHLRRDEHEIEGFWEGFTCSRIGTGLLSSGLSASTIVLAAALDDTIASQHVGPKK